MRKVDSQEQWRRWQRSGAVGTADDAGNQKRARARVAALPVLVVPPDAPPPKLVRILQVPGASRPHMRVELLDGIVPHGEAERSLIFVDGRGRDVYSEKLVFPWHIVHLDGKPYRKLNPSIHQGRSIFDDSTLAMLLQAALRENRDPSVFRTLIERSLSPNLPVELKRQLSTLYHPPLTGLCKESAAVLVQVWREKFGDALIADSGRVAARLRKLAPGTPVHSVHGAMYQWLEEAGIPTATSWMTTNVARLSRAASRDTLELTSRPAATPPAQRVALHPRVQAPPSLLSVELTSEGSEGPCLRVECVRLDPSSDRNGWPSIGIDGVTCHVPMQTLALAWKLTHLEATSSELTIAVDDRMVFQPSTLARALQRALLQNENRAVFEKLLERATAPDTELVPLELDAWPLSDSHEAQLSSRSREILANVFHERYGDACIARNEGHAALLRLHDPDARIEVVRGAMHGWLVQAGISNRPVHQLALLEPIRDGTSNRSRRWFIGGSAATVAAATLVNRGWRPEPATTPATPPPSGTGPAIHEVPVNIPTVVRDTRLSQDISFESIGVHELNKQMSLASVRSIRYREAGSQSRGLAGYYRLAVESRFEIRDGKAAWVSYEDYERTAAARSVPVDFSARASLPAFAGWDRFGVRTGQRIAAVVSDADVEVQRCEHTGDYRIRATGKPAPIQVYTVEGEPNTSPPTDSEREELLDPNALSKDWRRLLSHLRRQHKHLNNERRAALVLAKSSKGFTYDMERSNAIIASGDTPKTVAAQVVKERAGACDKAALGFAALLRAAGVPARVPEGFVVGLDNEDGDPHAWVEFWNGKQWYELEPQILAHYADAHDADSQDRLDDYRARVRNGSPYRSTELLLQRNARFLRRHRGILRSPPAPKPEPMQAPPPEAPALPAPESEHTTARDAATIGALATGAVVTALGWWSRRVAKVREDEHG